MVYEYNVQYAGSRSHHFSEIDLHTNHPCEKISCCPSKTKNGSDQEFSSFGGSTVSHRNLI